MYIEFNRNRPGLAAPVEIHNSKFSALIAEARRLKSPGPAPETDQEIDYDEFLDKRSIRDFREMGDPGFPVFSFYYEKEEPVTCDGDDRTRIGVAQATDGGGDSAPTPFAGPRAVPASKLSINHEAIMNFMLAFPGPKLIQRCARHFGFRPGYLYNLVRSDAFKAQLRDRQDLVYEDVVLPLQVKMSGVADAALDNLSDKIPDCDDGKFLLDVVDRLSNRLGYGSKPGPSIGDAGTVNMQNNYYSVDPQVLAEARQRSQKGGIDASSSNQMPAAKELPVLPETSLGQAQRSPALSSPQEEEEMQRRPTDGADL